MTNEHWRGFTQIDASFCLELNMFEVSQGSLIFYNIYLSQPSHFASNQSDERFREYFLAFRSVCTSNFCCIPS